MLAAFFDPHALAALVAGRRSVTTPRPMGVFAVEWAADRPTPTTCSGAWAASFTARVMEYLPGRELFVADAWWLPPDGDPIGPMALEVSCRMSGPVCRLQVKQTGFEDTPRWRRYYAVIASGWRSSLAALKEHVENAPT